MFAGRFDEAIRRFEECVAQNLNEGRPVAALVAEVAVCQATTYAGRSTQAREHPHRSSPSRSLDREPQRHRVGQRRDRRGERPRWDVPAALAAYRTAIEEPSGGQPALPRTGASSP